jgi:2,3-diaminopropionate biosynthesis protein SbnB
MKDIEFVYLNQSDIRDTGVSMETALESVEDAFRLHHQGQVNLPYKTVLDLGERERGRGNAMPAYVGGEYDVFGIKWIAGFPKNPAEHDLPRGTGLFILNDAWKGIPLAVMDCTLLSAMRTGAVTGVGAKYLARPDSKSAAIIGAGVQARTQLEALMIVVPGLKEVRAYDIRRETAESFTGEMNHRYAGADLRVRAVDTPEEAVREADIIVTVTVADEPIVKERWMKQGSFFAAVGSYQEEEFEVVSNSDKVVVDGIDHVLHRETPVIALMIDQRKIRREDILEIGAIVCGDQPGRTNPEERVFFSPIGMAIEDVCLCHQVYKLAKEKGLGSKLGLFGRDL